MAGMVGVAGGHLGAEPWAQDTTSSGTVLLLLVLKHVLKPAKVRVTLVFSSIAPLRGCARGVVVGRNGHSASDDVLLLRTVRRGTLALCEECMNLLGTQKEMFMRPSQ